MWIEFGSSILNDIWGFYVAPDASGFEAKATTLSAKFDQIERRIGIGPYFHGVRFSLVDAVFGPVFRYFDVFDKIGDFRVFKDKPTVNAWRAALASRPSIKEAVGEDYETRLLGFLEARKSHLSRLIADGGAAGHIH